MASDTLYQQIFLAGKDVLHVAEKDIKVVPFKTKNTTKKLNSITITINDAERFSQFSQFFQPTRQELCKSYDIKSKGVGKQADDRVWAFRVSIKGNKDSRYDIQFLTASQTVSYSTIYDTDVLIAHYETACDWIRTTYHTVRSAATEARTEERGDQAAVNDDSVPPDQETVNASGAVSVDHEVGKIATNLGDLPGNVKGLHVEILDSVDCYGHYMGFLDEAVRHSVLNPDKVDLYISSAPHIHQTTLYDVIKHIEGLHGTLFKCITFFFRKSDFDSIISSNEDSAVRVFFQATIPNKKVEVYVSSDKYFHTKWCAYVAKSDRHVKTLFTSAILTTDHLKPWQHGEKSISNSVVTDRIERKFFVDCVLNPQHDKCSKECVRINWDRDSKVFKPGYSVYRPPNPQQEKPEQPLDIPQNMSNQLIFQNVVKFIKMAKTSKKGKTSNPSAGNCCIYIVSPFIISKWGDSSVIENLHGICCGSDEASSSDQADLLTKIVHSHDGFSSKPVKMKLAQIENQMRISLAEKKFHCKFIAWVRSGEDEVRILQTSANFNSENMSLLPRVTTGSYSNLDWIVEYSITKAKWMEIKHLIGFD